MKKLSVLELQRKSEAEFKLTKKIGLTVVLDNVRSLHNVGSVFRTADAFCIDQILLCGITATPPHAEIHKTALGAEDTVSWSYYEDTLHALDVLQEDGYILCAIEQVQGSIMLPQFIFDSTKKYAVILGNEVKGVQQSVVDKCQYAIEIPQEGTKHSLNVSVTAGIVMWDAFKALHL